MTAVLALTRYDVTVPKAFPDRKTAIRWAEEHGCRFGVARLVQHTKRGLRTVWRPAEASPSPGMNQK